MKKQYRPLVISASIMVLLAVAYLLIRLLVPDLIVDKSSKTISYNVTDYELSELSSVEFDFADGYSYTIALSQTSTTSRSISIKDKEGYPFESTELSSVCSSLGYMTASRYYEDVADDELAEYGLDKPAARVTVSATDGTSVVLLVGSGTTVGNFAYVMREGEDTNTVYVVNSYAAKYLLQTDMAYRDREIMTISDYNAEIRRVTVDENGETVFDLYQFTEEEISNDESIWYSWYLYAPVRYGANDSAIESFFTYFATLTAKSVVEDAPQDLAKYGLDAESAGKIWTITILNTDETTLKMTISEYVEDLDGRYVMIAGTNSVYFFEEEYFSFLENPNWLQYKYRMVWLHNLFDISTVEISSEAGYHILEVDAPQNDDTETPFIASFDGNDITENNARQLYALIIGMTFYDSTADVPEHDPAPAYTFTMTQKKGGVETVELYRMNSRQYAVYKDGEYTGSYTNVSVLNDIFNAVDKVIAGDKITEF